MLGEACSENSDTEKKTEVVDGRNGGRISEERICSDFIYMYSDLVAVRLAHVFTENVYF